MGVARSKCKTVTSIDVVVDSENNTNAEGLELYMKKCLGDGTISKVDGEVLKSVLANAIEGGYYRNEIFKELTYLQKSKKISPKIPKHVIGVISDLVDGIGRFDTQQPDSQETGVNGRTDLEIEPGQDPETERVLGQAKKFIDNKFPKTINNSQR